MGTLAPQNEAGTAISAPCRHSPSGALKPMRWTVPGPGIGETRSVLGGRELTGDPPYVPVGSSD